jgi:uncharacterized membrane protein
MPTSVLIAIGVIAPALIIWLCYRFAWANKIGPVVICYAAGITLGNVGVIPAEAFSVQETMADVSVALALPLLLFSMDVAKWPRMAGKALISMGLAVVSIVTVVTCAFVIIRTSVQDSWKVAGLVTGVYTGGTPNMAAIKSALDVDPAQFIVVHTYDTVITIVYIIFCVTFAQRLFLKFLPPFRRPDGDRRSGKALETEDIKTYGGMFGRKVLPGLLGALLLSAAVVGVSLLLSRAFPEEMSTTITILGITTLAIVCSLIGPVRRIDRTFQLGMYIIYVFCFVVGSMAKASMVVHLDVPLLLYVLLAIFGSMTIHAGLCWILKVDADTFIITSVSAICSPPFVPVVAGALGNRTIVLSGLTTGIVGYAIGNYLGISLAYLLRGLGG